jgi:hypothetical protein
VAALHFTGEVSRVAPVDITGQVLRVAAVDITGEVIIEVTVVMALVLLS